MTSDRRHHDDLERRLEHFLADMASPIPPEVVDETLTAIRGTRQSGPGRRSWPRVELFRIAGLAAGVALAAIASFAFLRTASPGLPPGAPATAAIPYEGVWETIDCARWWQDRSPVDCSVWGDASQLRLTIGPGMEPTATYEDSSAVCPARQASLARFTANGTGTIASPDLWLTFTSTGCPSFGADGNGRLQLYLDPGSDTLWEDEDGDGWGLLWRRAR